MMDEFLPPPVPPGLSDRIRVRHLRCFVAVAREQHVGRAADTLNLSQPAVTKTLNELESLAGTALLDRGRHGTRLTAAGHDFLRYAREAVLAVDAAATALAGAAGPSSALLRIGALPTVASSLLPDALVRLRAVRPTVGAQIRTDTNATLVPALADGSLDVVVGRMADPAHMRGCSFELLYSETLVFVVRDGHELAGRPVSLTDVLDRPLVVAPSGTVPRHSAEALVERNGLRLPPGMTETLDTSLARGLVRRTDSVWVTTERAARDDLADGVLRLLDTPATGTVEPVGVLRRSTDAGETVVDEFVSILRDITVGRAWQDSTHG